MENKNLQSIRSDMRDQINEWWDELTENGLDTFDGDQKHQKRYRYTRNLAFVKVKIRMTSARPEGEGRKHRSNRNMSAAQYPGYKNDDWHEINNDRGFSKSGAKVHAQGFADQYHK